MGAARIQTFVGGLLLRAKAGYYVGWVSEAPHIIDKRWVALRSPILRRAAHDASRGCRLGYKRHDGIGYRGPDGRLRRTAQSAWPLQEAGGNMIGRIAAFVFFGGSFAAERRPRRGLRCASPTLQVPGFTQAIGLRYN